MGVSSFFSQNKDSDGGKERGNPGQMLNPAESTERFIMVGWEEAERRLGFCTQQGSAGSPVPLSAAAVPSSREGKEDARGTSEPAPAFLFPDHLVHFHLPGSDEEES